MTSAQKSHEYEQMDSQTTRGCKTTGAQKKTDAYKLMESQKTREYELTGAQKTNENSSCVKVRKNDGVEIIHECQRKCACRDVDVKPVVRDPIDDDRVLVESGPEMTPVPHEPSEFEKQNHNLTHIPISTMVHIMRQKAKHKRNHTSEQSASSKTANSQ